MFGFDEQSDQPLLPPEEIRIQELKIEPWPDSRRVKVLANITPFEQRPNLELTIRTPAGEEVASVSIVEILEPKFVITMHLRGDEGESQYKLTGLLFYPDQEPVDQVTLTFELPPMEENRDTA